MTNEEKAMELFPTVHTLECMCKGVREKLVAMAEWKDEQYKTDKEMLINKAWNFIRSHGNHFYHQTWEEIEEAFKNYME